MKTLIIILCSLALTSCNQFQERGLKIKVGAKFEDSMLWGGIGIEKSPELAERETLNDTDWEIVEDAARDNFPTIQK